MSSQHWRQHAACRSGDPELWFPIGTTAPALDQVAEAKAVCGRCPVAAACLAWATKTGQAFGVWGGLTEQERGWNRPADQRRARRESAA